jgi:NADH:ubiquinone oxidoreductase subunit 6 (subunit J)
MPAIFGLLGAILCVILGIAVYGAAVYCYFWITMTWNDMKATRLRNAAIREARLYR